jgi:hypothetical protein
MEPTNWTADNVTEVAIKGRWSNGHAVVNVFHVQREEDDAAASARDVLNNWQDHVMDTMANNYTLEGCHFRDRNEAAGVVGDLSPDPAKNLTGQTTGAYTSPNVAILVKKTGVFHAGQKPGRFFLPGIPEGSIDEDGNIDSAYITGNQPSIDDFLDGLSGAGSNQLVVVHQGSPASQAKEVTEVTALPIQTLAATQRRRMRS